MTGDDRKAIRDEFRQLVNMPPRELDAWLGTEESQSVGQTRDGEDESVGHRSGRRIVEIKRTKQSELSDDDYAHMKKVIGYIKRHRSQRPSGDIADSNWRYSLMNWGHDPMKAD